MEKPEGRVLLECICVARCMDCCHGVGQGPVAHCYTEVLNLRVT